MAAHRGRYGVHRNQRQPPIALDNDQFAAVNRRLKRGDEAAFGEMLLQMGCQVVAAAKGEIGDAAAGVAGNPQCRRIIAVQHGDASARDRFGDDRLHRRQILDRIDVLQPEVIVRDVEDAAHVATIEP